MTDHRRRSDGRRRLAPPGRSPSIDTPRGCPACPRTPDPRPLSGDFSPASSHSRGNYGDDRFRRNETMRLGRGEPRLLENPPGGTARGAAPPSPGWEKAQKGATPGFPPGKHGPLAAEPPAFTISSTAEALLFT